VWRCIMLGVICYGVYISNRYLRRFHQGTKFQLSYLNQSLSDSGRSEARYLSGGSEARA